MAAMNRRATRRRILADSIYQKKDTKQPVIEGCLGSPIQGSGQIALPRGDATLYRPAAPLTSPIVVSDTANAIPLQPWAI